MKFGEYLKEGKNPEWTHSYLDYDKLKTMISDLMEAHVGAAHDTGRGASLSVARPTNAAGMPLGAKEDHVTQEQFFSFIEQEIRKIDMFTKKQVGQSSSTALSLIGASTGAMFVLATSFTCTMKVSSSDKAGVPLSVALMLNKYFVLA